MKLSSSMDKLFKLSLFFGCAAVLALEAIALVGWRGWLPAHEGVRLAAGRTQAAVPAETPAAISQRLARAAEPAPSSRARPTLAPEPLVAQAGYYDQLRVRLRWVQTRVGGETLLTPDVHSRILLAKSAAQQAGLQEVGLKFSDVYGLINAESSWVPRLGASKDGTPNLGIAQFEPATARLLKMRNPDDPVEAVHAAALHMKEAALWSRSRIADLKLGAEERAAKLREGVSIYYNLSSRGRAAWNGRNTDKLPRETQLHIRNTRVGAQQAELIDAKLRMPAYGERGTLIASSTGI